MEQGKLNINPDDCEDIVCECESRFFMPLYVVKLIPGIMVGAPQDVVAPQDSGQMACAQCGKPLGEAIKALQESKEEKSSLII